MRNILVFSLLFIFPFLSCKSVKNIEAKKMNALQINIVDVKQGPEDEPWNLNVEFELINETNEDLFVPSPSDIYRNSFVTSPHFFGYELNGYDCEHEILFSDGTVKKSGAFIKIEAKTRKTMFMKPFYDLSVYCEINKDEQRFLQIVYMPDQKELTEEFVKSRYRNESEMNLMLDVYSQIYRDTIISPPFDLSF